MDVRFRIDVVPLLLPPTVLEVLPPPKVANDFRRVGGFLGGSDDGALRRRGGESVIWKRIFGIGIVKD